MIILKQTSSDGQYFDDYWKEGTAIARQSKDASAVMVITPVLTGLAATSIALLVVVCGVVVALCRRRQARRPRLKLEAIDTEDSSHGAVLIASTATPPPPGHRSPADDTDPDIIPNKYERRPLKGFMKIYKTPPQRRRKKDDSSIDGDREGEMSDEGDGEEIQTNHVHSTKDAVITHNQTNNIGNNCGTLRGHKGITSNAVVVRPQHNHKAGPEVVTASHRIQESCI